MSLLQILKIVAAAIGYLIVNVFVSVIVVAVYAYLINPGHPDEFYQEFAQYSAPYSSILAGMPLMFLLCFWLGRTWDLRSIIGIWIAYAIIDLTVILISGMTSRLAVFVTISLLTKLAAAVLGAKFAKSRRGD